MKKRVSAMHAIEKIRELESSVMTLREALAFAKKSLDSLSTADDKSVSPQEWNRAKGDETIHTIEIALAATAPKEKPCTT